MTPSILDSPHHYAPKSESDGTQPSIYSIGAMGSDRFLDLESREVDMIFYQHRFRTRARSGRLRLEMRVETMLKVAQGYDS